MDDNRETKFIELLSREINRGSNKFNFSCLNVYLVDAIKALPDGNLKDSLLKNINTHSEYLWSLIKDSKKSTEISFHIFNKDGLEETLKNITALKSSKEQLFYLSQVSLCLPSKDIFDSLLKAETAGKTNQSKLQTLIKVTELCGQITVGCNNLKVLHGLMHFFLSEVGNVYEDLKSSDQTNESWLELKDTILGLLIHSHLKSQRQKEHAKSDGVLQPDWTEYRDLLAAILSLYIDVLVMVGNGDESGLDHLSNVVYLLLGDSPSHILDTINQVSTLDRPSVQILLPFLRKVLCSTRICCTGFINYIKYISAAWKVLQLVENQKNDILAIKKVVDTVVPPHGLVTWLSDKDDSLVEDLGLSGLNGKKVTEHLLKSNSADNMEKLLDLVAGMTDEIKGSKGVVVNEEDIPAEDESETNPIFFVDSKGSSELVEQCKEEEFKITKSDKMLQKQIDAILERLEAISENEEEEFDVSLHSDEERGVNVPSDIDPNQASDIDPNQASDIDPNQASDIDPNQASDIDPNQASDIDPNQASDIDPNQASDIDPNQASDIDPNQDEQDMPVFLPLINTDKELEEINNIEYKTDISVILEDLNSPSKSEQETGKRKRASQMKTLDSVGKTRKIVKKKTPKKAKKGN